MNTNQIPTKLFFFVFFCVASSFHWTDFSYLATTNTELTTFFFLSTTTHWATLQILLGDYSIHWDCWLGSLDALHELDKILSHFECQS